MDLQGSNQRRMSPVRKRIEIIDIIRSQLIFLRLQTFGFFFFPQLLLLSPVVVLVKLPFRHSSEFPGISFCVIYLLYSHLLSCSSSLLEPSLFQPSRSFLRAVECLVNNGIMNTLSTDRSGHFSLCLGILKSLLFMKTRWRQDKARWREKSQKCFPSPLSQAVFPSLQIKLLLKAGEGYEIQHVMLTQN